MSDVIRLSRSSVGDEEKAALNRVIDGGYLGMGAEVQAFEHEIAASIGGNREVVCVATGTAALHLALAALDIGSGDEVIIPTITYVASFQAVSATGATAVACDMVAETAFMDVADAERRITPHTKAIMPVHYASDAGHMDAVYVLAERHGLRVIEDAAHAFGCVRNGAPVGATGDILCFSFDGIKNITSGEGGAIVTGDALVAQRVRDARLLGVERDTEARYSGGRSWDFDASRQGFRYHMSNLMAALGREQLRKLSRFSERRRTIAARYRAAWSGSNAVRLLDLNWADIVPHIFVVRIDTGQRDGLVHHLRERGIECGLHYKPNHFLSLYGDGQPRPVAEKLYDEMISLPIHAELTDKQQDRVIAEVDAYLTGTADG